MIFFLKYHNLYQQKMGTADDLNYFHAEFRIHHCSWYANTADALRRFLKHSFWTQMHSHIIGRAHRAAFAQLFSSQAPVTTFQPWQSSVWNFTLLCHCLQPALLACCLMNGLVILWEIECGKMISILCIPAATVCDVLSYSEPLKHQPKTHWWEGRGVGLGGLGREVCH